MKNLSKIKIFIILTILILLYTLVSAISYSNAVSSNLSENIFRLHVIAASNSEEDQNLKYIVRDEILKYMNELTKNATSKQEVIELVNNNVNTFKEISQSTIKENGYNYDVKVSVCTSSFPTKNYGDISLPAGEYDSLKIEIGEASGQNWWCVLFPPLCFVDVSSGIVPEDSKEIMKENLSEESYNIIAHDESEINFKFKILEIFQNVKTMIANN